MKGLRGLLVLVVAVGVGVALWKHGPISQPGSYHRFADARTIYRIPNALNVLSSIPFFIVGWMGLAFLRRGPTRDPDGPFRPGAHTAFESFRERPAYVLFFAGVLLTTFGSGYYHLKPTTTRLFWDRLPMVIAFTALFAAMIAERISVYWSRMLLLPLLFGGVASVVMWRLSEDHGRGDLRVYLFVQIVPMLTVPLMLLLYPPRYSRGLEMLVVVVLYGAAKALEHFDARIWELTSCTVSGHSLKHLLAASAAWFVLDMLKKRGRALVTLHDRLSASGDDDLSGPPSSVR